MTTTTTTDRTAVTADGFTPLPFYFQAIAADQVAVLRNGITYTSGFSVSLNGDGTGTVTPLTDWGTDPVTIYSNPNYTQPTAFSRFAKWFPDQLNLPLDRLARTLISLAHRLGVVETSLIPTKGDPGGNVMSIGLATAIISMNLSTAATAGTNLFHTEGYTSTADGGEAWYRRMSALEADEVGQKVSADGARLALVKSQPLSLEMFGGKRNDAAAGAANDAALEAIKAFDKVITDVYYGNAAPINLWHGDYYFADAAGHDIKLTRDIIGHGGGVAIAGGSLGTRCIGPTNWKFLRIQSYNTTAETVEATPTTSAAGTGIRGVHFIGHSNVGSSLNDITEGYAIHPRTPVAVFNCRFSYLWNGIFNNANSGGGGAIEGQASHCSYDHCAFEQNRNAGIWNDDQADNNVALINHCNFVANGRCGAYLGDFLGGEIGGACHFRDNGARTDYFNVSSQCTYGGNRYYVNQTATMATSDASLRTGNPTTNTLWTLVGAGGVHANYPDFSTFVGTFQKGGPIVADRSSNARYVAHGHYGESAQPPFFWNSISTIIPQLSGAGDVGYGLAVIDGKLTVNNPSLLAATTVRHGNSDRLTVWNSQALAGGLYAATYFAQGLELDGVTPANLGAVTARSSTNNPATAEGTIEFWTRTFGGTGGMTVRAVIDGANLAFRPPANNVYSSGMAGFRWNNVFGMVGDFTTSVKVNGVKVLGAQMAAVASPSGGATVDTQARTAIDAIRNVLATHGLTL